MSSNSGTSATVNQAICCTSPSLESATLDVEVGDDKPNHTTAATSSSTGCMCSCNTGRGTTIKSACAQHDVSGAALQRSCQCLHCSCDEFCSCQASEIIALFDTIIAPPQQATRSTITTSSSSDVAGHDERIPMRGGNEKTEDGVPTSRSAPNTAVISRQPITKSIQVSIIGMTCTMCAKTITNALNSVTGVVAVQINASTNSGIITYNPAILRGKKGVDKILETIEGAGYDVQLDVSSVSSGIRDGGISSTILYDEEAMEQQDFTNNDVSSTDLTTPLLPLGEASDEISASGQHQYRNRLEQREARQAKDLARRKRAFLSSLIGTVPIFFISMVLMYLPLPTVHYFLRYPIVPGFTLDALLLWILCTPVQFGSGWVFYKNSYHNIRNRALGMDVLIAIGITASYTYAVILILLGIVTGEDRTGAEFFETSAVLISFVLLGKWLQLLAVRRTGDALTKLMNLAVKRATLVVPQQEQHPKSWNDHRVIGDNVFCPEHDTYDEMEVDVDDLKRGDYVKIIRGSGVPADGVIIYGEVTVDESMITGESMPVYKVIGDHVLGGSMCEEGLAFVKLR